MSWADKFNLLSGLVILRLICGLFFVPHLYAKFFVPEALGFFVAAGFKPPAFYIYLACAVQTVLAIGLIFHIYTPYVAALAGLPLCVPRAPCHKAACEW